MVKDRLLSYEEAMVAILATAHAPDVEMVGLSQAVGRVLAEPIHAPYPMPRFTNSAVDGYAISEEDRSRLESQGSIVIELEKTIAAGDLSLDAAVSAGGTIHVLTGAPVPHGTGAVIMQEDAIIEGSTVRLSGPARARQHIRIAGEEYDANAELLSTNSSLTPAGVSLAAAAGKRELCVWRRPRVGMLSTGNELTPPGLEVHGSHIYESNSYGVEAALNEVGIESFERLLSPDLETQTVEALRGLIDRNDVVITSGGVSVGQFDTVKSGLSQTGVRAEFWGVAIKPGKPFYFGLFCERERVVPVFGLPGNPVSALVTLALFVIPYLQACKGLDPKPLLYEGTLSEELRKKKGRQEFVPARSLWRNREWVLEPFVHRGSHMLGGLAFADSLILIPSDCESVGAGSTVSFLRLPWRAPQ